MTRDETEAFWGKSIVQIQYMAFHPTKGSRPWPRSRRRRLWMRLTGWTFFADSAIEAQRKRNAKLREILVRFPTGEKTP